MFVDIQPEGKLGLPGPLSLLGQLVVVVEAVWEPCGPDKKLIFK